MPLSASELLSSFNNTCSSVRQKKVAFFLDERICSGAETTMPWGGAFMEINPTLCSFGSSQVATEDLLMQKLNILEQTISQKQSVYLLD